jgi:hypothetical protein
MFLPAAREKEVPSYADEQSLLNSFVKIQLRRIVVAPRGEGSGHGHRTEKPASGFRDSASGGPEGFHRSG